MISQSTRKILFATAGLLATGGVLAAGADLGNTTKQATNWVAIAMFVVFVAITLGITKWAAARTKTAADFYTAGGGITAKTTNMAIATQLVACFVVLPRSAPAARTAPAASSPEPARRMLRVDGLIISCSPP
jgi:cation/acetate symporter